MHTSDNTHLEGTSVFSTRAKLAVFAALPLALGGLVYAPPTAHALQDTSYSGIFHTRSADSGFANPFMSLYATGVQEQAGRTATLPDPTLPDMPWQQYKSIFVKQRYRGVEADGTRLSVDTDGKGDFDKTVKKSYIRGYLTKQTNPITGNEDYFLITDVFFNNDGITTLAGTARYGHFYNFRIPYSVVDLNDNGTYKPDSVVNIYAEAYERILPKDQMGVWLSQSPHYFKRVDAQSFYPPDPAGNNYYQEYGPYKDAANLRFNDDAGARSGRSRKRDLWTFFKASQDDKLLQDMSLHYGDKYKGKSYGIGISTNYSNYAYHMHLELKIKPYTLTQEEQDKGITLEQKMIDDISKAGCYAVTSSFARGTKSSYTFVSGLLPSEMNEPQKFPDTHDPQDPTKKNDDKPNTVNEKTQADEFPLQGLDEEVFVGDSLKNYNGEVDSNQYTIAKDGKTKPHGMKWGWKDPAPQILQTKVGITTYTADGEFKDGSHAYAPVKITVRPHAPEITTNTADMGGKEHQTIEVDTQGGVPDGATVTLYDKTNKDTSGNPVVLGTGTVKNNKATIVVKDKMPTGKIYAVTEAQVKDKETPVTLKSLPSPEKDTTGNIIPIDDLTKEVPQGYVRVSFAKDDASIESLGKPLAYDVKTDKVTLKELNKPNVKVKYGYDKTTVAWASNPQQDENVPIKTALTLTASATQKSHADLYQPAYPTKKGKVGETVAVGTPDFTDDSFKKTVPPVGTTFENADNDPNLKVDKDTGRVSVTIPQDKKAGDVIETRVKVKYPDNTEDTTIVTVIVAEAEPSSPDDKDSFLPKYDEKVGKPKEKVVVGTPTFFDPHGNKLLPPEKTTYEKVGDTPEMEVDPKTGNVTFTIPEGKKTGDKVGGWVKVTYPDGTSNNVPVVITVQEPAPSAKQEEGTPKGKDTDGLTPSYPEKQGKPNTEVEVGTPTFTGKDGTQVVPPNGTKYERVGDDDNISVDPKTGKVIVKIPADKQPGEVIEGKIKVIYPDGSEDIVPIKVTVATPSPSKPADTANIDPLYSEKLGKPGDTVTVGMPTFVDKNNQSLLPPADTTYEKASGDIEVGADGNVVVTIPADKRDGDEVTGSVKVTYPDGSFDIAPVRVRVAEPQPENKDKDSFEPHYPEKKGKPGETVDLGTPDFYDEDGKKVIPPKDTTFEKVGNDDKITVDPKTGKVTIKIPDDAPVGSKVEGKVKIKYPDGSSEEITVTVTVTKPIEKKQDGDTYDKLLTPSYAEKQGQPKEKVDVGTPTFTDKDGNEVVPPQGTTYEGIDPDTGVELDKTTGHLFVTIPEGKQKGDVVEVRVRVKYPDNTTEEIVAKVIVSEPAPSKKDDPSVPQTNFADDLTPKYAEKKGKKGETVNVGTPDYTNKDGAPVLPPDGTTYERVGDDTNVTVDPNTGKVTIKIPDDKNPGDVVTAKVKVKYPDKTTEEVDVKVVVGESTPSKKDSQDPNQKSDHETYTPHYIDKKGEAGETVEISSPDFTKKGTTGNDEAALPPDETTYERIEVAPQSDTVRVKVASQTGKITVEIPETKKPGDEIVIKVRVKYPDGTSSDTQVKVTVDKAKPSIPGKDSESYEPKYPEKKAKPGEKCEVGTPTFTDKNGKVIIPPDNTKFKPKDPNGNLTVDPNTGNVIVHVPSDKNPGSKVEGKVIVTYPDGTTDEVTVTVTVDTPSPSKPKDADRLQPKYPKKAGKPGDTVEVGTPNFSNTKGETVLPPDKTTYEKVGDTPDVTVDQKTGNVSVVIPADKKAGDTITVRVKVKYPDGTVDEVPVVVVVGEVGKTIPNDSDGVDPKYPDDKKGKPGSTVDVGTPTFTKKDDGKPTNPPEGTTFETDPNGPITVDPNTGKVQVKIPADAPVNSKVEGKVTITYPDGSKEDITVTVTVGDPETHGRDWGVPVPPEGGLDNGGDTTGGGTTGDGDTGIPDHNAGGDSGNADDTEARQDGNSGSADGGHSGASSSRRRRSGGAYVPQTSDVFGLTGIVSAVVGCVAGALGIQRRRRDK